MTPKPQANKTISEILEEATTHYERVCLACGNTWLGLHCPHDGYQNPCPNCEEKPRQVTQFGDDKCNGVTDLSEATQAITQAMLDAALEGEISERNRWITPIQQKVLDEINACLSPRITDLINNTHLGNSTVQKALKKLIEVGLVRKIDNIYSIKNGSDMFKCEYGCKNAGSHYHNKNPEQLLN